MNETAFYSRKARVDLKFRNYHPWINALNAKDDFHMILQFKSELLLVINHMSKILPPFFLFFSPPLSVIIMLWICYCFCCSIWKAFIDEFITYKIKAILTDLVFRISMIWSYFTLLFESLFLQPNQTILVPVLPPLCSWGLHQHTGKPTFRGQC